MQSDYELVSTKDASDALVVQSEDENVMGSGIFNEPDSTDDIDQCQHALPPALNDDMMSSPDVEEGESMMTASYPSLYEAGSKLASTKMMIEDLETDKGPSVIRYEALVPISRPPTKGRDVMYYWFFILQLGLSASIGIFSQDNFLHDTIILYSDAGSWASTLMIGTLIGSFLGVALSLGISMSVREMLVNIGMPFSIVLQFIVGNVFLALKSEFWYLGAMILIFAISDTIYYKISQENIKVSISLLDTGILILQKYGWRYSIAVLAVIVMQTGLLLWWGVVFSNVISHVSVGLAVILILFLMFSLYWTVELFHSIMAALTGGCVLWYFLKDNEENLEPDHRVPLYLKVALTSSFGSMCKGALFAPFAQMVLSVINFNQSFGSAFVSLQGIVHSMTWPLQHFARRNNRLSFSYIAAYGLTFHRAASVLIENSENLSIVLDDTTSFVLKTIATGVAGVFALILSLLAEKEVSGLWPVFVFICFLLVLSGISLVLHALRSAVDSLIIAYSVKPEKFMEENPILYHRFARRAETSIVNDDNIGSPFVN